MSFFRRRLGKTSASWWKPSGITRHEVKHFNTVCSSELHLLKRITDPSPNVLITHHPRDFPLHPPRIDWCNYLAKLCLSAIKVTRNSNNHYVDFCCYYPRWAFHLHNYRCRENHKIVSVEEGAAEAEISRTVEAAAHPWFLPEVKVNLSGLVRRCDLFLLHPIFVTSPILALCGHTVSDFSHSILTCIKPDSEGSSSVYPYPRSLLGQIRCWNT